MGTEPLRIDNCSDYTPTEQRAKLQDETDQGRYLYETLMEHFNDAAAAKWCVDLYEISHYFDDIYDRDIDRPQADAEKFLMLTLFDVPSNPFYLRYQHLLMPMVRHVILQWVVANRMEKGTLKERRIAYVLRNELINLFVFCASLLGGETLAREVASDLWDIMGEDYDAFIKEF